MFSFQAVALSQNRQIVALSQKPPKLLCYLNYRQLGCVISKTANWLHYLKNRQLVLCWVIPYSVAS
jgi:hypothetical protein